MPPTPRSSITPDILPDSVWLQVLAFADAFDLLAAADAGSPVLARVATDISLWRSVCVQNVGTKSRADLRRLVPRLGAFTKEIHLLGKPIRHRRQVLSSEKCFPASFLESMRLRCPELTSFSLEGALIKPEECPLVLPAKLQRLSLRGTRFIHIGRGRGLFSSPLLVLKKRLLDLKEVTKYCTNIGDHGFYDFIF